MTKGERRRYSQSVLDEKLLGIPPTCPYHVIKNMILGNRLFYNVRKEDVAGLNHEAMKKFEELLKINRARLTKRYNPPEPHLGLKERMYFLKTLYSFFYHRLRMTVKEPKLYIRQTIHNVGFSGDYLMDSNGKSCYVLNIPPIFYRRPDYEIPCYYREDKKYKVHTFCIGQARKLTLTDPFSEQFFKLRVIMGTIEDYMRQPREDMQAVIRYLKRDKLYKSRGDKKKARYPELSNCM
jgi:hypothetical protein